MAFTGCAQHSIIVLLRPIAELKCLKRLAALAGRGSQSVDFRKIVLTPGINVEGRRPAGEPQSRPSKHIPPNPAAQIVLEPANPCIIIAVIRASSSDVLTSVSIFDGRPKMTRVILPECSP
jgi:hypothetical protein